MIRKYWGIAALALLLAPAPARADVMVTPFIGANFGGDAEKTRMAWGVAFDAMGAGAIGFQLDFSYGPDFFNDQGGTGNRRVVKSNVASLMANLVVGAPIGGQSGPGVRPYLSGGVGWLRTDISGPDDVITSDNSGFGMNVGAGLNVFTTDRIGFRGDVRYFRSLEDPEEDNEFDIALGGFNFWRGTAGLVFRF